MMLDCMISELTCKEDLLDFFDKLEKITGKHNLASTINELRQGAYDAYAYVIQDMTKTRNGLENGLVRGLSQTLWKASYSIVLLF